MSKRISNAEKNLNALLKKINSNFQFLCLKQIIALVTHKPLQSNKAHDIVQHIELNDEHRMDGAFEMVKHSHTALVTVSLIGK